MKMIEKMVKKEKKNVKEVVIIDREVVWEMGF